MMSRQTFSSVSTRDVFDANQIQAGFHERGHSAVKKLDDDAASRGRLVIERTDRRGRIYDDDRQTFARGLERSLLGEKFRSLVRTDHISERDWGVLAPDLIRANSERSHGTGVNDLRDTCALRCGEGGGTCS